MKRLAIAGSVILALGLFLGQVNGSLPADENKSDDESPYFPAKVGASWEYSSAAKKNVITKITGQEKIEGVPCFKLETDTGSGVLSEFLGVKADGIYRFRANGQDIKPPVLVLKLPPKKGDSWQVDSTVQGFAFKGKLTVGEEKLTVGKKEYETVSVKSSDMVMGGQSVNMEDWYAKDVGLIRKTFKLPAAEYEVVLELEKFTPGK